jgi:hypothetical protein
MALEMAHLLSSGAIFNIPGTGKLFAWGTSVPTTVNTFAPGCIFIHTDGTAATRVYVNNGTYASPSFVLMPSSGMTGAFTFGSTLGVTGAATLSSTLNVTGATVLSSTLGVTGAAILSSTLAVTGVTTLTGALTLGNTAHGGLLAGAGVSATPYTMTGASKSMLSFYGTSADTADSNRGVYAKLTLSGAAGGGEAMRAYAYGTTAAKSNLRGLHATAEVATAATITGEMAAVKGTLQLAGANAGGYQSCLTAEFRTVASTAFPATHGAIFVTGSGDATANALFKNLLLVDVPADCVGDKAAAKLICNADVTAGGGAATYGIQCRLNGVQYWLPLYAIS